MNFEAAGASSIPDSLLSQSRSQAAAVGYAHGWSQGLREARESLLTQQVEAHEANTRFAALREDSLRSALSAIASAADQVEAAAAPQSVEIEDQILAAAVEIAQALVGRELLQTDEAARAAVARVLSLAPEREEVRIRINADLYAELGTGELPALLEGINATHGRQVILEPDVSLAVGDAIGHCGASTIDARLAAGIQRVRDHLEA
ncbi:MAG TPA: FliH/SctL family protein [Jatrophihabitans sp.]|jgi:flagellar assembly protein FliH